MGGRAKVGFRSTCVISLSLTTTFSPPNDESSSVLEEKLLIFM